MGNDGGRFIPRLSIKSDESVLTPPPTYSIPTRRELVKSAARNPTHSQVRDTQAQTRAYRWSTCQLSKKPLSSPIVSDSQGILYNKDSIIEWLLHGVDAFGDGEEVLDGRVKSLKDVVEVKFEQLEEDTKADSESAGRAKWVCSVSRKELGPGGKAAYLVPCGHAFEQSAVREIGGRENGCLVVVLRLDRGLWELIPVQCSAPYEDSDIIPINPDEPAEIERLKGRVKALAEKGLTHALKKLSDKKSKKRKADEAPTKSSKKTKEKESRLRNSAAAALTGKVMEDEKLKGEQRKLLMSDNIQTLFSKKEDGHKPGKNRDFMSRGYSLPAHMQR